MRAGPVSRVRLVALLALVGAACAGQSLASGQSRPRIRPAPPTSAPVLQLRRDLTALFSEPAIDHALWSVRADALDTGETLFTYNGHRLMVPASNQKLLTASVAASLLGWDYRFTTRLVTNASVDAEGTLKGDLFVVGDGDPTINPRHGARWRIFDDWAAQLHAMGIRTIEGHLIGDDDLVDEPGWGEGWGWDDLQYGYGAAIGALQYNENQIEVTIGPGLAPGTPAIVFTSPIGGGLMVDSTAVTVASDAATKLDVSRLPGTLFLLVRGQIAAGAPPIGGFAAVDNPTRFYVSALREALGRHEIVVGGSELDIDDRAAEEQRRLLHPAVAAEAAPQPAALRELIVDRSPPLSEIVDVMLKWSRNDYAETLLTALSATAPASLQTAKPSAPQTTHSAASGLMVLQSTLDSWGVPATAFKARDGSGLSRMDYVSADGLVKVLAHMWTDPKLREPFRAALPVAGVSGTLAERLKGTSAAGRVWAKTGTLSNVRALSGYLETEAGEPLVFSILVNNFVVPPAEVDAIVDRALLKLMELPRRPSRRAP